MEAERPRSSLQHPAAAPDAVQGSAGATEPVLLVRTRAFLCALPIGVVVETMRPLPVRPAPGVPWFVRGLAIVRGAPLPVIDLGALLGASGELAGGRFITIRSGLRHLVLAVDAVVGVRNLDLATLATTPPLLVEALPAQVERLGALDGQTLAVLGTARLLADEVAEALDVGGAA